MKKNKFKNFKILLFFLPVAVLMGCAQLHHIQISDIDNRAGHVLIPFDIKVSETGVSMQDIKAISKSTNSQAGNAGADIAQTIQYFQMGPRTGLPVYSDKYAEKIIYNLFEKCPEGHFTGVTSVRETRKYPVISGEIIHVTGYCIKTRKVSSVENSKIGVE